MLGWMLLAWCALCAAFAAEKKMLRKSREQLSLVIHVNGTRGKTTTCRMLDAVLRVRFRLLTKTTGTQARVVHVGGQDLPLRRMGPANIMEQARTLRAAAREKAEIAIMECMAVRPALQQVSENEILQANIGVITNVRLDHMLEMGDSLDSVAHALCRMIPTNGTLYTADQAFFPFFSAEADKRGSDAILCTPEEGQDANMAIVRRIGRDLGMTDTDITLGLSAVRTDSGMQALYCQNFLNLFAANDPQSALECLAPYQAQYAGFRFVYNHRIDRPDRLCLFAAHFFSHFPGASVYALGDAYPLVRRLLTRHMPSLRVIRARRWQSIPATPENILLVGLGNTKGEALRMLASLEIKEMPT